MKLTLRQLQTLRALAYQQLEGYPPSPIPTESELRELWLTLNEMASRAEESEKLLRRLSIWNPETD